LGFLLERFVPTRESVRKVKFFIPFEHFSSTRAFPQRAARREHTLLSDAFLENFFSFSIILKTIP
jgi:hypothetical protein